MDGRKIETFIQLAGQNGGAGRQHPSPEVRKLGAQLLLSEVLEYVINGLGVVPEINGVPITKPDELQYRSSGEAANRVEMLDGLADVAYTMYWNALMFGLPLEEAFELVCNNNLEKLVHLHSWERSSGPIERHEWHCNLDVSWPSEVVQVEVVKIDASHYAVGKDVAGKVRKPSSYRSVDLSQLLS